jgi:hypothetical protein
MSSSRDETAGRTGSVPASQTEDAVERFNEGCGLITVDEAQLWSALETDLAEAGLPGPLLDSHGSFFAEAPVFLSRHHVVKMGEIIGAVECVARSPRYLERIREWAPPIASFDPGPRSVFFGYDFHLGPDGPRLIEINTNAAGALFNTYLAKAQQACCPPIAELLVGIAEPSAIEDAFVDMFREEWRLQRAGQELTRIAIVDVAPREQPMYPEFVLFQRLFERNGVEAVIADPSELLLREGALWLGDARIDLVYNRVCDFYLEAPEHEVLREAYTSGAAAVTPHPRAYALYADKRNLTLLSSREELRGLGVDDSVTATLAAAIPATLRVAPENAGELWQRRRGLFFKPVTSYGSRGAYRGAKLTRRVWDAIVVGAYVAQDLVPPSERHVTLGDGTIALKVDLRAYAYAGEIQFLAARLYRGQTTNMRTPGGGFAPVFTKAAAP